MKTYNQFLNTPFSEEIKPPEPQEEDPGIKSKEKRQMQIKKQVLLKKMQAVRAGAGADIVASHTPEGEMVEGTDKAFEYVKKQIAAKYGKSGYVSKDNPRKPQTDAEKKKVAAHKAKLAKQDHRDPTEKASDGRYSDRHSNRGSD